MSVMDAELCYPHFPLWAQGLIPQGALQAEYSLLPPLRKATLSKVMGSLHQANWLPWGSQDLISQFDFPGSMIAVLSYGSQ